MRRRRTAHNRWQLGPLADGRAHLPRTSCAFGAQLAAGVSEDTIFRQIESALFPAGGRLSEPDQSVRRWSQRDARSDGRDCQEVLQKKSCANGGR